MLRVTFIVLYRIAADIVVFIHLLWIIFLLSGAWWGRKYPLIKRIHIGGVLFALFIQTAGWYCPLTHLEVWLRSRSDPPESYGGAFIAHYVGKIVYIDLSPGTIFILTVILAVVSAWLYMFFPVKPGSRKN